MTELQCLLLNLLLHVIATIVFRKKYGWTNLATLSMLLYTISALFSVLFFLTPFYLITESYKTAEFCLAPAIWLFCFNVLLCLTLRYSSLPKVGKIRNCDRHLLDLLQIFTVAVFLIIIIFGLSSAITNFRSEDLADLRSEAGDVQRSSGPFIVRLLSRFFGGFSIFLLVLPFFNFFILKRRRHIDLITLLLYFIYQLEVIANAVSRASILFLVFQIIVLIICFKDYIPSFIRRKMVIWSIPIIGIIFSFFVAITFSRFSQGAVSATEEIQAGGSVLRYAGEGQLNFNTMMYDRTNGCLLFYETFPLYRRLLGLPYAGDDIKTTGSVHSAYTDSIHPYPNYIFYQAGGRWYLDMGKYFPIFLLILINILIRKQRKSSFSFISIVVIALWGLYVMAGIFWAQYGSEPYNFLYIAILFLYLAMKERSVILPNISDDTE